MNILTANQREANRRALRVRIWSGVWRANGFSRATIDALPNAEIDSNRRPPGLTRKAITCIEGIGDRRIKESTHTGRNLRRPWLTCISSSSASAR